MSSYNVKLYEYYGSRQVRKYRRVIEKADEKPVEQFLTSGVNGEYIFHSQKTVDYNKILRMEKMKNFPNVGKEEKERTPDMIERSIASSVNRTKNKIYEIARSNKWEYFITLTFNPQKVNSKNYEYVKDLVSEYFHKERKVNAPDLKYLIVPELHSDGKKYHFHGVLADIGKIPMIDSGRTTTDEKTIYNIGTFSYGFTTATKVQDTRKVSAYITKYITKDLCIATENRRRYLNSNNCARPVVHEYNMTAEEYDEAIGDLNNSITHMKTVSIPLGYNKVDYIEITD